MDPDQVRPVAAHESHAAGGGAHHGGAAGRASLTGALAGSGQAASAPNPLGPLADLVEESIEDGAGWTYVFQADGAFRIIGTPTGLEKHVDALIKRDDAKMAASWKHLANRLLARHSRPPLGGAPAAASPPEPAESVCTAPPQAQSFVDSVAPQKAAAQEADAPPSPSAMSQFVWYGKGGRQLAPAEIVSATAVLAKYFDFCSAATLETAPEKWKGNEDKRDPNAGYYWFKANGMPSSWGGWGGATQYVKVDVTWSQHLNDVTVFLSADAPGARPGYMKDEGIRTWFRDKPPAKGADTWKPVPADLQDLDLLNIPGSVSCMATCLAMLARSGLAGPDGVGDLKPVKSETYVEGKGAIRAIDKVELDPAISAEARAYLDFETAHGRRVLVGVTYTNARHNDKITDHWIIVVGRAGEGYAFHDPGTSTTAEAGAAANVLTWDGEKLVGPPKKNKHAYVVSWVRPNTVSLGEWNAHWAKLQQAEKAP